jgi:hypothetical protein
MSRNMALEKVGRARVAYKLQILGWQVGEACDDGYDLLAYHPKKKKICQIEIKTMDTSNRSKGVTLRLRFLIQSASDVLISWSMSSRMGGSLSLEKTAYSLKRGTYLRQLRTRVSSANHRMAVRALCVFKTRGTSYLAEDTNNRDRFIFQGAIYGSPAD